MTGNGTLDDRYLEWLYSRIATSRNRNPSRSYWHLAVVLFSREFTWSVPNDDNRIADGLDLREKFIEDTYAERDQLWLELPCSVLEMLVALSDRIAFEVDGDAFQWFWVMAENAGLRHFSDASYGTGFERSVNDILDTVIDRTYAQDGRGGLFPLRNPSEDQREVEIWYQMQMYLMEQHAID